jgi:dihydrofolate reductase
MAKILVANHLTLDGVMQAPARPEEDTRDGFTHGGWAIPRGDQAIVEKIGERMAGPGGHSFLLGRRTYEDFYDVWPKRTGDPLGEALTATPKYVASRTLSEPLPWANSVLLAGDAADAVAKLTQELDGTLVIFGSGELVASLMAANLIDEYLLIIHPVVIGAGRRMFREGQHSELRLLDSATTKTGVVMATYEPLIDRRSR